MKRILALLLSLVMLFSGCAQSKPASKASSASTGSSAASVTDSVSENHTPRMTDWQDDVPQYTSLNDTELLAHVEDLIYRDTVSALNSADYLVSDVSAVYVSKSIWKNWIITPSPIFTLATHWMSSMHSFKGNAMFSPLAIMEKPLCSRLKLLTITPLKPC